GALFDHQRLVEQHAGAQYPGLETLDADDVEDLAGALDGGLILAGEDALSLVGRDSVDPGHLGTRLPPVLKPYYTSAAPASGGPPCVGYDLDRPEVVDPEADDAHQLGYWERPAGDHVDGLLDGGEIHIRDIAVDLEPVGDGRLGAAVNAVERGGDGAVCH